MSIGFTSVCSIDLTIKRHYDLAMSKNFEDIKARIRGFYKGMGLSQIASVTGVKRTTLADIYSENWNPTLATLEKLLAPIPEGWKPAPRQKAS